MKGGKDRVWTFRHLASCSWEVGSLGVESDRRLLVDYFSSVIENLGEIGTDGKLGAAVRNTLKKVDGECLAERESGTPTHLGLLALRLFTLYAAGKQNDGFNLKFVLNEDTRLPLRAADDIRTGSALFKAFQLLHPENAIVLGCLLNAARNFNAHQSKAHALHESKKSWWTAALLRGLNFMTLGILLHEKIRPILEKLVSEAAHR